MKKFIESKLFNTIINVAIIVVGIFAAYKLYHWAF